MKIKLSEASALQVDFLVATCEGRTIQRDPMGFGVSSACGGYWIWEDHGVNNPKTCYWKIGGGYSPTTNWPQGGPIIEREGIATEPNGPYVSGRIVPESWCAKIDEVTSYIEGPTLLLAAMRCYVSSKLGDEVDIPKELT